MFADTDLKFDQPQAEVVFDRDKLRSQGVDLSQAGRDLSALLGGELRQPLQHPGTQLQGDSAGEARRTADPRSARRTSTSPVRRQAGAALDVRHAADDDRAARAEEVPAAERRPHPGRHSATGSARPGAEVPGGRGAQDPASGLHHRLCRRVEAAAHRGQQVPRRRSCCRRC